MNQDRIASITHSERVVLELLAQGYDIKACATELGISDHAVGERLRGARRKLGVTSSRQAARLLRASRSYRKHGDAFQGVAEDRDAAASSLLPDRRAPLERDAVFHAEIREYQLSYEASFAPTRIPYVPVRQKGAGGNDLSRMERLQAIGDLSIKLAAVAALLCLLALAVNLAMSSA